MQYLMVNKKTIRNSRESGIEKSVPLDHRLSSIGKPCDAKRQSSGQIFLSHPHTHMIDCVAHMSRIILGDEGGQSLMCQLF